MGVRASGGYYVAMAADRVLAHPTTVTGSIGVIFSGFNVSGLMEKLGVEDQTLTSGAFKDAGSPLRRMNAAERAQLPSVIDDLYEGFLEVVARGRPGLERAAIERLADGRIYSARQALALGLVDAIGYLPESVEAAKRGAGISGEARVVVYHRPRERRENLFSAEAVAGAPEASRSPLAALGGRASSTGGPARGRRLLVDPAPVLDSGRSPSPWWCPRPGTRCRCPARRSARRSGAGPRRARWRSRSASARW